MMHANDLYRLILIIKFISDFISYTQHFNELLIDDHRQCFHEFINSLITAFYLCDFYIFINNLLKLIKVYVNVLAVIMHFRILYEIYC